MTTATHPTHISRHPLRNAERPLALDLFTPLVAGPPHELVVVVKDQLGFKIPTPLKEPLLARISRPPEDEASPLVHTFPLLLTTTTQTTPVTTPTNQ